MKKTEPLIVPQAKHYLDTFIHVSETFPGELVYFEAIYSSLKHCSFHKIGKKFCFFYGPGKLVHLQPAKF